MPRNRRPSLGGQRRGSKSRKKSSTRRRSSSIKDPPGKLLKLDSPSPTELTPLISGSPSEVPTVSRRSSLSPSKRYSKSHPRRFSDNKSRRRSTDDDRGGGILLNKKKRRKSLAVTYAPRLVDPKPEEYLEGSDLDISRRPRILQLPTKVRVGIWKLLNNYTILILRQVCHRIKFDVDNFVGVHAVINQNHRSFGFFVRVGIRSAIVTNLTEGRHHGPIKEILVYPDLLLELSIQGAVSNNYFAYLMENCQNLVHLEIDFSKRLLKLSPDFFPTADVVALTQLRKLEITSETKYEYELLNVRVNLEGLFNVNLKDINISNFHFHMLHNTPSPALRECHQIVSNFVNRNSHDLVSLAITIKEKRADKRSQSIADFDAVVNQFLPHPAAAFNSITDFGNPVTEEQDDQDDTTEDVGPIDLDPFLPFVWRTFTRTKDLHLSINGIHAEAWKDMPLEMRTLTSLYLDIVTDEGNWYMYRTTVHNCASTLRKVYLMDVTREEFSHHDPDTSEHLINIDVGFFNACRNLKYLTIKCQETGSGAIYRMKSVSELPKSLTAIHFTWIMLSPFQMIRILVFYRNLHSFQAEYWSKSLSSFRRLLCLLKYVFKFNLTKAPLVTLVDHKVRFQNGLNCVKNIIRSLAPAAHYIDEDLTLLEIDTSILHK